MTYVYNVFIKQKSKKGILIVLKRIKLSLCLFLRHLSKIYDNCSQIAKVLCWWRK